MDEVIEVSKLEVEDETPRPHYDCAYRDDDECFLGPRVTHGAGNEHVHGNGRTSYNVTWHDLLLLERALY